MKKMAFYLSLVLAFSCLVLTSCSRDKEVTSATGKTQAPPDLPSDPIKDIQKPLEKAKTTQKMGEERTRAIDEALKNQ